MQSDYKNNEDSPVTEMAIVNTFTKLIFGDGGYTERESMIIQAFRAVDNCVLRDSHQEMGEYLRNLGVREMIQLVSRVRQYIKENIETLTAKRGPAAPSSSRGRPGQNRGAH